MPNQKLTLTDIQQARTGTITGIDKRGNATSLAGALSTSSGDESLLEASLNDDGVSVKMRAVGPLGTTQCTITDGMGTAVIDVEIIPSAEAGLNIPIGAPEDQPDV